MGCFLGCFGGRRKNRRRHKRHDSDQKFSVESTKPDTIPNVEEIHKSSVIPVTEICEEIEEKCSSSPRVTFESQVKISEHIVLQESVEDEVKAEEESEKSDQSSSVNDRYKNCRESDDDEEEELDCNESDFDEEYYSENELQNQTNHSSDTEKTCAKPRAVLNPVENLTQYKSAKSKAKTVQKQSQKENSSFLSDQEDNKDSSSLLTMPQIDDKPKLTVDASLSTWLSTSECNSLTPEKHKSRPGKISHDDRPILCALTLEEIKQYSATSTPRKSPSKSPDETPIIGTVGGYWGNHLKKADEDYGSASSFKGVPNTTSKYREDNKVKWHSTPFETRLEKALNNRDK